MLRMTLRNIYNLNSNPLKLSFLRSRILWLTLLIGGFAVWRAVEAALVSHFFVSTVLWLIGLAFAYWVVIIWSIVFSLNFDWEQPGQS